MSETINPVAQQNTNAPPQGRNVIASPNPTIDDSKTPATTGTKKIEATRVQPVQSTTQAPMKATNKKRSKHRRTRPRSD